jgi:hypothetical protein
VLISTACTSFLQRVRWRTNCARRDRRRRNARVGSSGSQEPCNSPAASSRASVRASRWSVLTFASLIARSSVRVATTTRATLVEPALGVAQPAPSALRGRQLGRQLVTAPIAELLGFDAIGLGRLLQDLARDLPVVTVGVLGRVGTDLRAVDRDHLHVHQASLRAQFQHVAEQLTQSGRSCRWRNRAIVVWSGAWLAVMTRTATSSWQRRSIRRDDRSPIAYA